MAPKKSKKISLNEFLGDTTLGSWADEMDSLPNAPAARADDDQSRSNDRYGRGRGDDFLASRPDRSSAPREDVPLPTQPPYTAFVGNLAFDLTELELEEFFGPQKTKSIKIIRDRDDKPKGFGYVEFEDIEGLKDALAKSGSSISGRTIRVSVAEPPKERPGFGGGHDDDSKFDNPWRRDGPLPDLPNSRDSTRRRFDSHASGERPLPTVSEGASDWRSNRPARSSITEPEAPSFKRKGSGFSTPEGQASAAEKEEVWAKGTRFVPAPVSSPEEATGGRFGSMRSRGDMGPPREPLVDEGDWRNSARPRPVGRSSVSPSNSTPPTPQMGRRKLELLPRSGNVSATPSPLSSPKMGPTPSMSSNSRSNPFGAAKPIDVASKDKEVTEKLEREREVVKERLTVSRTNSRSGSERSPLNRTRTPPPPGSQPPLSPKPLNYATKVQTPTLAPTVRPTLSFANVAAKKESTSEKRTEQQDKRDDIGNISEKVAEVVM